MLFDELKLPIAQEDRPAASTDAEVLEELARQHPLPAMIIEHRQYAKLKSTYVDALPALVHPDDGPDPCVVQPGGGRDRPAQLERSEPAEHPGPDRGRPADPPGVRARADGWRLLTADYSQIELRILAHFSRRRRLRGALPTTRTFTPGSPARSTACRWRR